MSLKLACPRCRHVQFFDDALAGEPASCAKCAQAFRVPRQAETEPQEIPAAAASWPEPAPLQVRELPTTFAPPEIAAVRVVELPATAPKRFGYDEIDEPISTATATPLRRTARPAGIRTSPNRDEPSRGPWTAGISLVAGVLLMFAATAAWFLLRNDQRPQDPRVGQQNQFNNPRFQPQFPPPQQFPPPMPGVQNGFQQPGQAWRTLQKGQMAPVEPQGNEKFIELKLVNGELKVPGAIAFTDPSDPLSPACRRKVYLVELEAKRNYTIEMNVNPPRPPGMNFQQNPQPGALDPFLMLQDEAGKILDWNDDIVEVVNVDSRIKFQAPAKAKYRIIATTFGMNESGNFILNIRDDDKGKAVVAKNLPAIDLPKPVDVKQPLAVEKTVRRNLTINTLLTTEQTLVGDMCWSRNAAAFFVLDDQGTVRRINWPAQREERRLETEQTASSVAMSRAGLLVSFPKLEEVWLIDPETLLVKKRISVPGVQRITASPTADVGYAAAHLTQAPVPMNKPLPKPRGGIRAQPPVPQAKEGILVFNAVDGNLIRQYDFSPLHATVTPDGKYLFAEGGIERLRRYRIDGNELVLDDESPRLAGKGLGIFVSPDSKLVCLTSPGGNYAVEPNENLPPFTTLIFKTDDLKKPAVAIETGESPHTIGYDSKSGWIFGHNNESQFMRFNRLGVPSLEEKLPGEDRLAITPRQFLAHPDGRHVLIRTERNVFSIESPK